MPPRFLPLSSLLRSLVLRLVVLLGGVMEAREAMVRARLGVLPAGHRRRRALLRTLARVAWMRECVADPGFWDDPRMEGKAAEVARCVGDAGRRAAARRFGLMFSRGRGMRRVGRVVALVAAGVAAGRCRCGRGVA